MSARTLARLGTAVAGIAVSALAVAGPAQGADAGTIMVPDDFDPAYSDTRATGSYEVQGTGLRIWTEGTTSTDKVAEYVDTDTPLADVGEPTLDCAPTSGTVPPGYQLLVDFDDDGTLDGILVGEPTFYGASWWLNNAADADVKANAPTTGGGSGSPWHGTLDEWRAAFPEASVKAFGFSLGSGVKGDGVIGSITFAGTTYTFAEPVVLTSREQCKQGGWRTSTAPVFTNQGDCVSSFARST